jgi:CheY-like chemotaxis protein
MIHIRSELGKGTEVEVNLPLEKSDSSIDCSSMARSDIEVYGLVEAQKCLEDLRNIAQGKTIAIIRDNTSITDGQACLEPKWQCIEKYFTTWFGFTIIDPMDLEMLEKADVVIGEKDGSYLKSHLKINMDFHRILLIREGMTCVLEHRSCLDMASVENIWYPIGPYKLARAVLGLFKDRTGSGTVVQNARLEIPSQNSDHSSTSTLSSRSSTPKSSTKQSIAEHSITRHTDADSISEDVPTRLAPEVVIKPEPLQVPTTAGKIIPSESESGATQAFQNMHSLQKMQSLRVPVAEPVSPESPNQTFTPGMVSPQIEDDTSLRVLAVDDNILNLQLLHRYLIKRPNDIVVTARNGVEAVAAVRQATTPFDIILMDLSMPDMDGFEATRLIRVFEKSLKHREASEIKDQIFTTEHNVNIRDDAEKDPEVRLEEMEETEEAEEYMVPKQIHAYIVALTGLASRRDRDAAEESGFDDFLTKPISFAKIGKLLTRKSAEKGRKGMLV